MMPDQTQVAVNPPPVLLCSMAEAVAQWIRTDVGPAAAELGAPLAAVTDLDSYECRSRKPYCGRQAVGTARQCARRQRHQAS